MQCSVTNAIYWSISSTTEQPAYKYLQKYPCAWYCPKCHEGIILFTTISNEELYQTNQGCKINFTAVTKQAFPNQDLIDQVNDVEDNPMIGKVSTKYYGPYKVL